MARIKIPVVVDSYFIKNVVRGVTASAEFKETVSEDYKKGFLDFADTLINTLEKISRSGTAEQALCDSCKRMTLQEAVKWLKAIEEKYIHGGDEDFDEKRKIAINTAIYALEKQIPKKATEEETNRGIDISGEYDIDFHLCCPVCGAVVGTYEAGVNEYFENYCSNCGQAIDVSYSGCEEGAEE